MTESETKELWELVAILMNVEPIKGRSLGDDYGPENQLLVKRMRFLIRMREQDDYQ